MKALTTFTEFLNETTEETPITEALNAGKARDLAHLISNKLVDMEFLKPKQKTEELLDTIEAIILNYK